MGWVYISAGSTILLLVAYIVRLAVNTPNQHKAIAERRAAHARLETAVSELRDGEAVSLSGVVRAGAELLEAPLSGTDCVFWVANARTWRYEGRRSFLLGEFHDAKLVPFRLETPSGTVEVHGDTAETELVTKPVIPRRIERDTAFLVARGAERQHVRQAGLDELAVVPGDRICVHGVISIERAVDGDGGYRDEGVTIRLVDHPTHRLTLGKAR